MSKTAVRLADGIREAKSEHVVFFLLTSYLDLLAAVGKSMWVPRSVTHLPIAGDSDVENRAGLLRRLLSADFPPLGQAVLNEAVELFVTASERLLLLRDPRFRQELSA